MSRCEEVVGDNLSSYQNQGGGLHSSVKSGASVFCTVSLPVTRGTGHLVVVFGLEVKDRRRDGFQANIKK